ncbi:MAG: succinate dehydrogenase assembly factor 2 [Hyphomicrobiaceae bacterium]
MSEGTGETIDTRRRRALYRAQHRGTKEMDWLLGRFVETRIAGMDAAALDLVEALIERPDPEIQHWILTPADLNEPEFAGLIAELRRFHGLDH